MSNKLERQRVLEDKLFTLMEKAVDKLTERMDGECSAADIQASISMLKHNSVTLEAAGRKGEDPDLPDEEDLPFTEGDMVSYEPPLKCVK